MGGGFTMSKKRNTMNAQNWPVSVTGVTISSTDARTRRFRPKRPATGRHVPSFFAVKPQIAMPPTKPTPISTPHSITVR